MLHINREKRANSNALPSSDWCVWLRSFAAPSWIVFLYVYAADGQIQETQQTFVHLLLNEQGLISTN